jgi:hypothetical protein
MDFPIITKLRQCLEIIDDNKPIRMMVQGKWHTYIHYEITFDSELIYGWGSVFDYPTPIIWFLDDIAGSCVPVNLNQIEQWQAVDASDELKTAIADLKELI